MISVTLNGTARQLDGDMPLPDLLRLLDIDARRVAVAINGEVVPKRQYGETTVRDADVIEVVRMVGGGAAGPPS
jgi:sulfur carrier protein